MLVPVFSVLYLSRLKTVVFCYVLLVAFCEFFLQMRVIYVSVWLYVDMTFWTQRGCYVIFFEVAKLESFERSLQQNVD